jgi:tripartite-type tricarboxylate transporter receptor subunit TctC
LRRRVFDFIQGIFTMRALRLLATSLFTVFASVAFAQEAYPSRPISMIVPFPPGGVADNVARPVAAAMAKVLGQPIVIENKQGAGGGVGMAQVAKAKPDGYTVLLALSSISIIPEADKVLGRAPMFTLNQLIPIARFTADPVVLAVRADSPWKTLNEFLAHAKSNPKEINYGSSGNYGTMHVPMEMLGAATGTNFTHVPFTGAGPAVTALLGGSIQAVASGPSTVVQQVKAGKVRVLASWGTERHPALPDVATLNEAGHKTEFAQWSGLFVPAGTPENVVAALRKAAGEAMNDAALKQTFATLQTPIAYQDAPAFRSYWDGDAKKMAETVQRIGKVE